MAGVSSVQMGQMSAQTAAMQKGGKPPHAGGPHKAKALPPGLQGKQLPPGNPWSKLAEQQQQQGQVQAPGATNTALAQPAQSTGQSAGAAQIAQVTQAADAAIKFGQMAVSGGPAGTSLNLIA